MKSAGVSLIRIMRPLIAFGILASVFSYLCSDYVIPAANLQFGSRMFDIREKKPALSLEEGVFNDDFGNYAIRIGDKDPDGRTISDILIYDHTEANTGRLTHVVAESGEMFSTPDGRYLVMQLYNGNQYVETRPTNRAATKQGHPFVRTAFESWNKVFDLSEFDIEVTDRDRFSGNRSMMTIAELDAQVDSLQVRIDKRYIELARQVGGRFSVLLIDSLYPKLALPGRTIGDKEVVIDTLQRSDSLALRSINSRDSISSRPIVGQDSIPAKPSPIVSRKKNQEAAARRAARIASTQRRVDSLNRAKILPIHQFNDTLNNVTEWLSGLNTSERRRFLAKAKSSARSIVGQAEQADITLNRTKENRVKHIYDLHMKYSMAVVCFIFVFIGAPLGAIVRKGGFGYPLLVSVVAFILFIVLTIFCRKIAETFIIPGTLAAWLPCIILFPIGLWLTNKARKDERFFS